MPEPAPDVAAIVLAGGSGTRLGLADGRNKVHLSLGGRPLLAWSLRTLDRHPRIGPLVLVVRAGDEAETRDAIEAAELSAPPTVVVGGATRSASEAAGVAALRDRLGPTTVVLLHDGARPFLSPALIDRLIDGAGGSGIAVPGLPLDPEVVGIGADGRLAAPPDGLRRVQTPQAVRADVLMAAFDRAASEGVEGLDTAELVAAAGGPAAVVVPGDPDNVKITSPADVERADRLVESRWSGPR